MDSYRAFQVSTLVDILHDIYKSDNFSFSFLPICIFEELKGL